MNNGKNFKLFLAALFVVTLVNISAEENSYDLQDKQVIWEAKKDNNDKIENIKEVAPKKDNESVIVKDDEKKDTEIKDIKVNPENKIIELPKEQPEENLIITSNGNFSKDNAIIFGVGGYREIDSFRYLIDYSNQIPKKELSYFLHLGRNIQGEYRDNTDTGIDNYYGEVKYKKYNIGLYHLIKSYEYPGETISSTPVRSQKTEKSTEFAFKYDAFSDSEKSLNVGFNFFNKNADANPTEREYNNNFYKFFVNYDKLVEIEKYKNFLTANGSYFSDKITSDYFGSQEYGKTGAFRAVLRDKVKIKDLEDITLLLKAGVEFASKKNISDEKNFVIGARCEKVFTPSFGIAAEFEKDSMTLSNREIIEKFDFDSDVMPFKELNSESNMKLELSSFFTVSSLYGEVKARYLNSNDKIYYEEGKDLALNNEREIYARNYDKSLNWVELELKGSHTYNNYRTELKYVLSSLDKISYSPKNKITASVIYEYKKYKLYLDGKYFGEVYNVSNQSSLTREKLCGAFIFDWKNSYDVNDKTTLSFNVLNLFDTEKEYKVNYPMAGRKFELELKIKY